MMNLWKLLLICSLFFSVPLSAHASISSTTSNIIVSLWNNVVNSYADALAPIFTIPTQPASVATAVTATPSRTVTTTVTTTTTTKPNTPVATQTKVQSSSPSLTFSNYITKAELQAALQTVRGTTTSTTIYNYTGGSSYSVPPTNLVSSPNLTAQLDALNTTLTSRIDAITLVQASTTSSQWSTVLGGLAYTGGNVGIGTSTPGSKLTVAGDAYFTGDLSSLNFKTSNVNQSVFVGYNAGINNVLYNPASWWNGSENTYIGDTAGQNNTTGSWSVYLGSGAGRSNGAGNNNVYIGTGAGQNGTTGYDNVLIGAAAGSINTGYANTFVGKNAGYLNTGGAFNSFFGLMSGYSSTGSNNTANGAYSLYDNTSGGNNTAFGYNTGRGITTGSNNTILGANVTGLSSSLSNNIIIADGAGNRRINVDSSGNVGIGTTSPTNKLHISSDSTTAAGLRIDAPGATSASGGALVLNTPSGSNHLIFETSGVQKWSQYVSGDNLSFYQGGDRVTFKAGGNVGINSSNPSYKLDVQGTVSLANAESDTANLGTIADARANYLAVTPSAYNGIRQGTNHSLNFDTQSGGGLTALTILQNGNVGIGTASPLAKLEVVGDGTLMPQLKAGSLEFQSYSTNNAWIGENVYYDGGFKLRNAGGGSQFYFEGGAGGFRFTAPGSAGGAANAGNYQFKGDYNGNVGIGGSFGYSSYDGATMFVGGNGNVGIGTTSPSAKLAITGSGTGTGQAFTIADSANAQKFTVLDNGNVGIGTASPDFPLKIATDSTYPFVITDASGITNRMYLLGNGLRVGSLNTFDGGNVDVGSGSFVGRYYQDENGSKGYWDTSASGINWLNINRVTSNVNMQLRGIVGQTADIFQIASSTGAPILSVSSSGNVGIGTTNPTSLLTVNSDSFFNGGAILLNRGGALGAKIQTYVGDTGDWGSGLKFYVTPSGGSSGNESFLATAMTIRDNGNIGIGTVTPSAQLTTTGTVQFANFGAGSLQTDANGNVTVSSDERLKDIQGNFSTGLSAIEQLTPISYKWKASTGYDTQSTYTGFSAQNVKLAIPEAISTDKNGYFTLSDRPILATLVNAVKEIASLSGEFKNKIVAWMGDAGNGIGDFFANRTHQKTLCVGEQGDETCITKTQLDALLQNAGQSGTFQPFVQSTNPVNSENASSSDNSDVSSTSNGTGNTEGTSTESISNTSQQPPETTPTADTGTSDISTPTSTSTSELTPPTDNPTVDALISTPALDPIVSTEPTI